MASVATLSFRWAAARLLILCLALSATCVVAAKEFDRHLCKSCVINQGCTYCRIPIDESTDASSDGSGSGNDFCWCDDDAGSLNFLGLSNRKGAACPASYVGARALKSRSDCTFASPDGEFLTGIVIIAVLLGLWCMYGIWLCWTDRRNARRLLLCRRSTDHRKFDAVDYDTDDLIDPEQQLQVPPPPPPEMQPWKDLADSEDDDDDEEQTKEVASAYENATAASQTRAHRDPSPPMRPVVITTTRTTGVSNNSPPRKMSWTASTGTANANATNAMEPDLEAATTVSLDKGLNRLTIKGLVDSKVDSQKPPEALKQHLSSIDSHDEERELSAFADTATADATSQPSSSMSTVFSRVVWGRRARHSTTAPKSAATIAANVPDRDDVSANKLPVSTTNADSGTESPTKEVHDRTVSTAATSIGATTTDPTETDASSVVAPNVTSAEAPATAASTIATAAVASILSAWLPSNQTNADDNVVADVATNEPNEKAKEAEALSSPPLPEEPTTIELALSSRDVAGDPPTRNAAAVDPSGAAPDMDEAEDEDDIDDEPSAVGVEMEEHEHRTTLKTMLQKAAIARRRKAKQRRVKKDQASTAAINSSNSLAGTASVTSASDKSLLTIGFEMQKAKGKNVDRSKPMNAKSIRAHSDEMTAQEEMARDMLSAMNQPAIVEDRSVIGSIKEANDDVSSVGDNSEKSLARNNTKTIVDTTPMETVNTASASSLPTENNIEATESVNNPASSATKDGTIPSVVAATSGLVAIDALDLNSARVEMTVVTDDAKSQTTVAKVGDHRSTTASVASKAATAVTAASTSNQSISRPPTTVAMVAAAAAAKAAASASPPNSTDAATVVSENSTDLSEDGQSVGTNDAPSTGHARHARRNTEPSLQPSQARSERANDETDDEEDEGDDDDTQSVGTEVISLGYSQQSRRSTSRHSRRNDPPPSRTTTGTTTVTGTTALADMDDPSVSVATTNGELSLSHHSRQSRISQQFSRSLSRLSQTLSRRGPATANNTSTNASTKPDPIGLEVPGSSPTAAGGGACTPTEGSSQAMSLIVSILDTMLTMPCNTSSSCSSGSSTHSSNVSITSGSTSSDRQQQSQQQQQRNKDGSKIPIVRGLSMCSSIRSTTSSRTHDTSGASSSGSEDDDYRPAVIMEEDDHEIEIVTLV